MKKETLIAGFGTLALLTNILLPGLAFGQAQTATTDIVCDTTDPAFALMPSTTITMSSNGAGGTVYAQLAAQNVFSHSAAALTATTAGGEDFVSVVDVRDPSNVTCGNNGLTLTLEVTGDATVDGGDGDNCYFEDAVVVSGDDDLDGICDAGEDNYIPLDQFYYVTNSDTCPTGETENVAGTICFDNSALCGQGVDTPPSGQTCGSVATGNTYSNGTAFTTLTTFTTGAGAATGTLGSADNTAAVRTILSFADGSELYGTAGLGLAYAATLQANQASGTYTGALIFTVTAS